MFEPGLPAAEPSPSADAASDDGAVLWDLGAARANRRRIEGGEVAPAGSDVDPGPAAGDGDAEAAGAGARLRVAQAAVAADLPAAVGRVERVAGSAAVVRNGVQVELHLGDPVYKGDVVQTGSGAALTVKFLDGTVLGLSAGARVVIDRMAYASGSSSNSVLFNLVQGAIGLVAGRAAASGDFAVDTPVATMGVRGTAVRIEILSDTGTTKFSLLREPNGAVGSLLLTEKAGRVRPIGMLTDARVALIVTALTSGEVSATPAPKSSEELRSDGALVRELFRYLPEQRQRRGSGDSDLELIIPASDLDLAPDSIDLGDLAAVPVPVDNLAPLERLPDELPDLVRVSGAATEDGPFVPLIPPEGTDIDVLAPSRLPAGVTFESRTGSLRLDPSDPAFQHLAAGETITVTVQYEIAFGSTIVPATASWKVVGRNDVPIARNDRFADADETQPFVLDLRGNDRDVDRDGLTVVSWTKPIDGTVKRGPGGGVVFDPGDDFDALSAGQTATVRFTYTVADGHGGTDTAVATVTVRGEGTFKAPATADTEAVILPVNGQTAVVSLEAPSRTTTTDAEVTLSVRFGTDLQPPLNVIYLIDVSGSTDEIFDTGGTGMPVGDFNDDDRANTVLDAEIANLIDLTQKIRGLGFSPEDVSVTLIPFSDDAAAGGGPRPNSFKLGSPGELDIQAYLKSLDSGGGTNFEAALGAAADALGVLDPTGIEQNHIYFLTDGDGTGSFGDELAALTGPFDAQISAVGVGADAQLGMLNSIDNTGGAIRIRSGNALDVPIPSGRIEAVELFVGGREITGFTPGSFVNEGGVLTLRVAADELARFAGDTNVIEAHVTLTGNQTVSTSVTIGGALPHSTDLDL